MTQRGWILGLVVAVASVGCGGGDDDGAQVDDALRTGAAHVRIEGAVRAEWMRVRIDSGGGRSTRRLRVVEGADKIDEVLSRLTPSDDSPRCEYLKTSTQFGMRMGGGRRIPRTGETIVFFDRDDERLATLYLYPCESTLVTLKRAAGPTTSYRRSGRLEASFTNTDVEPEDEW